MEKLRARGEVSFIKERDEGYSIQLDQGRDLWFSGWGSFPKGLGTGDDVEFEYVVKGAFKNIKGKVTNHTNDNQGVTEEEKIIDPNTFKSSSMKVKVISSSDLTEWENKINDFAENNNVTATQTHVITVNDLPRYVSIQYYN